MNVAPHLSSMASCPKHVVAFDGDDTLWVDSTGEQDWEGQFKHLAADRLPSQAMERTFRAHLKENGFTIDAVRSALLASGRDACGEALPPDWLAQVEALPKIAATLKIDPARGLEEALECFSNAGHALWIITKGDVVRQAIKLARFGKWQRFSRIEIVPHKTVAAYRSILGNAGVEPNHFLMIGDTLTHDVLPVLRLGGWAAHIPAGRWSVLGPLESMAPLKRLRICRSLGDAASTCLSRTPWR
jgi:putative hydrolase of the HAD superfamily